MLFYFFYIYVMKKYLLWLLALPIMLPLLSIASADSIDWFTSESEICKNSFSTLWLSDYWYFDFFECEDLNWEENNSVYVCVSTSQVPYYSSIPNVVSSTVSDSVVCYNTPIVSLFWQNVINACNGESWNTCTDWNVYFSLSPIIYSAPSGWGSDSILPELSVPSSFTSWITELVNNFWSTISEWIPVVILLTLWITCIYALFRVVRNYARRSFKW